MMIAVETSLMNLLDFRPTRGCQEPGSGYDSRAVTNASDYGMNAEAWYIIIVSKYLGRYVFTCVGEQPRCILDASVSGLAN